MGRLRQMLEWCCHKPRDSWCYQKLEEARKRPLSESLAGTRPCQHRDFVLVASRTERKVSVVLSQFAVLIMAALGHQHIFFWAPAFFLSFSSQPSCSLASLHHPTKTVRAEVFRARPEPLAPQTLEPACLSSSPDSTPCELYKPR